MKFTDQIAKHYIGCPVLVMYEDDPDKTGFTGTLSWNWEENGPWAIITDDRWTDDYEDCNFDFKPILRRLESMTEEESLAYATTRIARLASPVHVIMSYYDTPESFLWLLSKHFDLFGLIDSNQAIDAATLPA